MNFPLSIVIPNRNRLDFEKPASVLFFKSLQWQDCKNFQIVIVDGGSDNYSAIKEYIEKHSLEVPVKLLQYKTEGMFHKTILNNFGIKNCETDYIATTDADICFSRRFIETVIPLLEPNAMIEARTKYWKPCFAQRIWNGEFDPYNDPEIFKLYGKRYGRLKNRTTCGGFQCFHKDKWNLLNMYNEEIKGWGAEDRELLERTIRKGIRVKWIGENNDVMLCHQPHEKETWAWKDRLENQKYLSKDNIYIVTLNKLRETK